ncbi:hypothetical protein VDGD_21612 [Verticillium dahliae]|nr:hypothetical protein VDGD_21612 [Verticillium dahliae]
MVYSRSSTTVPPSLHASNAARIFFESSRPSVQLGLTKHVLVRGVDAGNAL